MVCIRQPSAHQGGAKRYGAVAGTTIKRRLLLFYLLLLVDADISFYLNYYYVVRGTNNRIDYQTQRGRHRDHIVIIVLTSLYIKLYSVFFYKKLLTYRDLLLFQLLNLYE